ncbi:hypothetical protein [Nostoc sp.]|uniref:hypothetical protein n=1 Tax=Nostoc sp. TaxID=1180 RepID=UPI002FF666E8
MQTSTSNTQEYFIFVNLANPFAKHNLQFTGQILSAGYTSVLQYSDLEVQYLEGKLNYLPFVINEQISTGFLSFYCASAITDYRVEYDAEMRRLLSFAKLPSRLSAVYAFATEEDCREAQRLYRWNLNSVRRFTLLEDSLTKVAKVNMEIISLMRSVYPTGMWSGEDIERIWTHYWSGGGNLEIEIPTMQSPPNTHKRIHSGEVWEYLVEGRLQLQGDLYTPIQF